MDHEHNKKQNLFQLEKKLVPLKTFYILMFYFSLQIYLNSSCVRSVRQKQLLDFDFERVQTQIQPIEFNQSVNKWQSVHYEILSDFQHCLVNYLDAVSSCTVVLLEIDVQPIVIQNNDHVKSTTQVKFCQQGKLANVQGPCQCRLDCLTSSGSAPIFFNGPVTGTGPGGLEMNE